MSATSGVRRVWKKPRTLRGFRSDRSASAVRRYRSPRSMSLHLIHLFDGLGNDIEDMPNDFFARHSRVDVLLNAHCSRETRTPVAIDNEDFGARLLSRQHHLDVLPAYDGLHAYGRHRILSTDAINMPGSMEHSDGKDFANFTGCQRFFFK